MSSRVEPSRAHVSGSPFGDPATVSVADTGAGLCVWVNRATGQLGNWATGQLVPSGDNGATGRRPASATSTQPSFTFLPSDLRIFLPSLPSFLPSFLLYLPTSGDPYLWSKIGLCGSPLMRSALPVNEEHLILVFFCRADLAPTETHERHRNRETATHGRRSSHTPAG